MMVRGVLITEEAMAHLTSLAPVKRAQGGEVRKRGLNEIAEAELRTGEQATLLKNIGAEIASSQLSRETSIGRYRLLQRRAADRMRFRRGHNTPVLVVR